MPCRFVLTLAGRDMGRVCLTVGVTEDGRMLIADGRTHKLENPKKKKLKHLLFLDCECGGLDLLIHRGALTDCELAKACKAVEDALDNNVSEIVKE